MYHLLPFTYSMISSKEVLVNELGDMMMVPVGTVERILDRTIDTQSETYKSLVSNFFLSEQKIPALLDVYAERLAEKKRFMENRAALHIFVLTLRCNQNCVYCQASSQDEHCTCKSMSQKTMKRAVELMFKSPSKYLTMEFQGGEPSLEPDLIEYGINFAEEINQTEKRDLQFVLCTNCVHLSDHLLEVCKAHAVLISTSLDGPEWLHNQNRGKENSYAMVTKGMEKARAWLGDDRISALMTTSELALDYPKEIIDEYLRQGFHSIFLRALNPYGKATGNTNWEHYTDKFIQFYKTAFEYILEINKQGTILVEDFASIILQKMLTPYSNGFVDLQSPAGIVNSVLLYNYDGYLYASDEARMLAETGDNTFRIGSVFDDYDKLVQGTKVKQWSKVWANETLAGCSDCGVRAFCGADPVRNHSTQGDSYGHRPSSLLCRKNKSIIEYLISLMIDRQEEVMPIFRHWLV